MIEIMVVCMCGAKFDAAGDQRVIPAHNVHAENDIPGVLTVHRDLHCVDLTPPTNDEVYPDTPYLVVMRAHAPVDRGTDGEETLTVACPHKQAVLEALRFGSKKGFSDPVILGMSDEESRKVLLQSYNWPTP